MSYIQLKRIKKRKKKKKKIILTGGPDPKPFIRMRMLLFTQVDPGKISFCSQKRRKKQQTKLKAIFISFSIS